MEAEREIPKGELTATAVVPARWASTRFPGKLLETLHGRSLLAHVHERLLRVRGLDRILFATDDERIASEVLRFGGEVRMTDPGHASGTDRIGEAVADLEPPPDLVLNLQGDEPVFRPAAVERLLEAGRADPGAIWTLADPITDLEELARPSVVKVVRAEDGRALYFSRAPVPFDRAGRAPGQRGEAAPLRHAGIYLYPLAILREFVRTPPSPLERLEGLEQLRAIERGWIIRVVVGAWPAAGVDTPEDLERLRRLYPTEESLARSMGPAAE